jgi:sulfhydrogenase subunit alpha
LVDEILKLKEDKSIVDYSAENGKGTGLVEAPRGLLIHHHEILEKLVSQVDIITPTAQNAEDIERYCHVAAQKLLDEGKEDQIRDRMDIIVRAFDPCISCSAHMAKIRNAPRNNWKMQLKEVTQKGDPAFIGVGNPTLSDDGVGIKLARELKETGIKDVLLESEIEQDEDLWTNDSDRPLIFLDAVDFKENPGKITLLPLHFILNNTSLSHRLLPTVSGLINYSKMKNAYVLGIQPGSLQKGNQLSPPVEKALNEIKQLLTDKGDSKEQ